MIIIIGTLFRPEKNVHLADDVFPYWHHHLDAQINENIRECLVVISLTFIIQGGDKIT